MTESSRAAISDYLSAKWTTQAPDTVLPVQRGVTQWLDASDLTTLFQDLSGVDNIYGQGYYTSLWKDKSGNGNDMFKLSDSAYAETVTPAAYNAGMMNGLPALDFSKGNGTMLISRQLSISTEITLFIVCLVTPLAGIHTYTNVWSHGQDNQDAALGITYGTRKIFFCANGDTYSSQIPYVINRPGVYVATLSNQQISFFESFDLSGNTIKNIIEPQAPYSSNGRNILQTQPISLGGWSFSAASTNQSGCAFSEVIYYQRVLSPQEITATVSYLTKKWGIYIPPVPAVPNDLPGLQLWLDAADPITTYQSGTSLTAWYDKSDRHNNPTGVGTPGYSPTTDISGTSFPIPGVTFNGTSQWFTLPNGSLPSGNSPFSYYIVATSTDVSGYNYGVISGGTNTDKFSMNVVGTNTMAITSDYRNLQSPDGINYFPAAKNSIFASSGGIVLSAWNGFYWLGITENAYRTGQSILKSFDGLNWFDIRSNIIDVGFMKIVWSGTVWVLALNTSSVDIRSVAVYSYDGVTWVNGVNLPTGASIAAQTMATSGSLTILARVVGGGSSQVYKSTDGITWSIHTSMSAIMPNPLDITFNGSTWVAGGYSGLAYSLDGYTWLTSANGFTIFGHNVKCLAASPTMFVAGGEMSGQATYGLAYSTDGITWNGTSIAYALGDTVNFLKWNGKVFVGSGITGPNGQMYSIDGVKWYQPTYNRLSGGMFINTMFSGSYGLAKLYPSLQTTLGSVTPVGGVLTLAGSTSGSGPSLVYSYDGINWYPSAVSSINTAVNSIGYNGSTWIVASIFQNGAYSSDGINWSPITDGFFTNFVPYSIAWNGSVWIAAVQNANGSIWSSDGITWTVANNGDGLSTGSQIGIATSGSLTVMVGTNNNGSGPTAWTSTDGKHWTANASLCAVIDYRPTCVAYNGTIWVAGGRGTSSLAWSSNGLSWTAGDNSPFISSDFCITVAWNGTMWVAGGSNVSGSIYSVVYSMDGKAWSGSRSGSRLFTYCNSVSWNGARWVACGQGFGRLAYSTDGIIWSLAESSPWTSEAVPTSIFSRYSLPITSAPSPPTPPSLAPPSVSTPSVLVTKSFPISKKMNLLESFYSAANNTVTEYANGQNTVTQGAKARYVIGGNKDGGYPTSIVYSYDGIMMNLIQADPLQICYGTAFNGSLWVAVGSTTGGNNVSFATSTDGINWAPGPRDVSGNPFISAYGTCIAWNASYWLAGGQSNGGPNFMKSYDGYTWTGSPNIIFASGSVASIVWNGSYWLALGGTTTNNVTVAKSNDGVTWTYVDSTANPFIAGNGKGLAWNGSIWVAVGTSGDAFHRTIAVSKDGLSWTYVANPFDGAWGFGIAWNGSYFICVGSTIHVDLGVIKSYDGLTWTPVTLPTLTTYTGVSVCWDGNRWAVTGYNNTNTFLAFSTDSINWTVTYASYNIGQGVTSIAARVPLRNQDVSGNLLGSALGQKMKGSIHEVLVYAADHGPQQRQFIENYLQNKWFVKNYNPASITTPMGLWLDANPANFVYSSGNLIGKWKDKSAGAVDCSQVVVINQPTYEFDDVTNRYGVRFGSQAITTALNSSISPFGATPSWSIVVVARFTQTSYYNDVFCTKGPSVNLLRMNGGSTLNMWAGSQESTGTNQNPTNAFIYTSSVDASANWINYFNGVPVKSGTSASAMTTASLLSLGYNTYEFSNTLQGCEGFTGYIFEMFAFKTALSSADQQALEGYLAWKWGIQKYLGNTYSSAPPIVL